jgi:ankyrin repeat protein
LNKTISDFTSSPMHLQMISVILKDKKEIDDIDSHIQIFGLYEKFIEKIFDNYIEKTKPNKSNLTTMDMIKREKKIFMESYKLVSLDSLLSEKEIEELELTKDIENEIKKEDKDPKTLNLRYRLATLIDNRLKWSHKTYQEFFAAKYFLNQMENEKVTNYFISTVLNNDKRFELIRQFIDNSPEFHQLRFKPLSISIDESIKNVLETSLIENNSKITMFIIDNFENMNLKKLKNKTDLANISLTNSMRPLHYAGINSELIKYLIQNDADVNANNEDGETALHRASINGHLEVVKLLIENNADVNAINEQEETALHIASFNEHLEVVKLLIENNANVNAKDEDGGTALHNASLYGHSKVVELLIEEVDDVNAKDGYGSTALHIASFYRHLKVVKLLLEKGADVDAEGEDGDTALHIASFYGHLEVVELLIEKGADVKAKNKQGDTALKIGINGATEDIIKNLNDFKYSCILNVVTKLFHVGIKTQYPDVIKHLRSCYDRNSPALDVHTACVYAEFKKG